MGERKVRFCAVFLQDLRHDAGDVGIKLREVTNMSLERVCQLAR